MKKTAMLILAALMLCLPASVLYPAKNAKKTAAVPKTEAGPVDIKSGRQLAEEMQKRGLKGTETDTGIMAKLFSVAGLKEFRKIETDGIKAGIYDFSDANGFNAAAFVFGVMSMTEGTEAYKSRPFIITFSFDDRQELDRAVKILRAIIPDIKEVSEKEY